MAEIRLSKLVKQYNIGLFELVDYLNSFGANIDEASVSPNYLVSDAYIPYLRRAGFNDPRAPMHAESWDEVTRAFQGHRISKGYVRSRTKGGFIVEVFGVEAFCPGSQMDTKSIKDYDSYVDKVYDFIIISIDEDNRNVVVSHRLARIPHNNDCWSNLAEKEALIEELTKLVEQPFDEKRSLRQFREIQDRWVRIGPIPQDSARSVNSTYQQHVKAFHEKAGLAKESKLKDNLDAKVALCEQAEMLSEWSDIEKAYAELQGLHERWKSIGPVAKEFNDSVWERFRAASAIINQRKRESERKTIKRGLPKKDAKPAATGSNPAPAEQRKPAKPEPCINPEEFFSEKALDFIRKKKEP